MAIIGAGPAGLALALQAARALPEARITVFDARPPELDLKQDPRTLALSLGSVQELERMGVWPAVQASGQVEPIRAVHVSQQQPTVLWRGREQPHVLISAKEQGQAQLGSVVNYGALVAPLHAAWQSAVEQAPHRLGYRMNTRVRELKPLVSGRVEVDADIAETHDLAVVAEGGVFSDQPGLNWPKGLSHDYDQTAWVGQVRLQDVAEAYEGIAYERFTPAGPAALLPLTRGQVREKSPAGRRAALVWCVQRNDDPVRDLTPAQRLVVLNSIFHESVGRIEEVSELKCFPLGLNAHRRLVSDGAVVRIGNAAQTLHPVAGQGLNLGLRDMHELLAALVHTPHTADHATYLRTALQRFERKRQPDRWALIAGTDFLARSFTWPAPILATARGLGLGAMQTLGPVKRRLARTMMFGLR